MKGMHSKYAFFALTAQVALAGATSCLSSDDAPAGGRVEHPPPRAPAPVASVKGTQDASPPPVAKGFTALDQAIADDCDVRPGHARSRPWSKNVPDRDCTNDGECGDGYCDRGHCAPIWTCGERWGQRCIDGLPVPSKVNTVPRCWGICLDGRCRSCQSHAECTKELETFFRLPPGPPDGFRCSTVRVAAGGFPCYVPGPNGHQGDP